MVDHLAAIRRESERFYAIANDADPSSGVPSCPGWSIADLVWHLGEVHWFWTEIIEARAGDPDDVEKRKPSRPTAYNDLLTWAESQADRMLDVLSTTADDVSVWTWALDEADHSVAFIRRHQVQEVAIHRWDLQNAATSSVPDAVDAESASDSIDEMLAVSLPWSVRTDKPILGTVHLHCTDTEGEWFVHTDGRVEPIHAKGDVAIRGAASDLLLALYKRVGLDAVELIGNDALARDLVDRINTD
jgi:uncharacterized protein (TIGR03083 family)